MITRLVTRGQQHGPSAGTQLLKIRVLGGKGGPALWALPQGLLGPPIGRGRVGGGTIRGRAALVPHVGPGGPWAKGGPHATGTVCEARARRLALVAPLVQRTGQWRRRRPNGGRISGFIRISRYNWISGPRWRGIFRAGPARQAHAAQKHLGGAQNEQQVMHNCHKM